MLKELDKIFLLLKPVLVAVAEKCSKNGCGGSKVNSAFHPYYKYQKLPGTEW